jgi:hypothetical protein
MGKKGKILAAYEAQLKEEKKDDKEIKSLVAEKKRQLEDARAYNQKIEAYRRELEAKYPKEEKSLNELRDEYVEALIQDKKEFFFGRETPDEEQNNIREYTAERQPRIVEHAKPDAKVAENVKSPEEMLEDYAQEIRAKYNTQNAKLRIRKMRINGLVKEKAQEFQREVQLTRKLQDEAKELAIKWRDDVRFHDLKAIEKEIKPRLTHNMSKQLRKDTRALVREELIKSGKYYQPDKMMKALTEHMEARKELLKKYWITYDIDPDRHDDVSTKAAKAIWDELQTKNKNNSWIAKTPQDKIKYFNFKYEDFCKSFPVTLKYMIFQNQWNEKAFRRYLKHCRKDVEPGQSGAPKGDEAQKLWLTNQSYYVRFLYEERTKERGGHVNFKHAHWVQQESLKLLMKERDEFTGDYEDTRDKLSAENIVNEKEWLAQQIKDLEDGKEIDADTVAELMEYTDEILQKQQNLKAELDRSRDPITNKPLALKRAQEKKRGKK